MIQVIRTPTSDDSRDRLHGIEAYLGNGYFCRLTTLCTGRVGRMLLCDFFRTDRWSEMLSQYVQLAQDLLEDLPYVHEEDFVTVETIPYSLNRQIAAQQVSGIDNSVYKIRHQIEGSGNGLVSIKGGALLASRAGRSLYESASRIHQQYLHSRPGAWQIG